MRAVIIAGGGGTQIKPFSYIAPKALLPLGVKPLLSYHVEKLRRIGLDVWVVAYGYEDVYRRLSTALDFNLVFDKGMGAAHALHTAMNRLGDDIFYVQGNVYTEDDYREIMDSWDGENVLVCLKEVSEEDVKRFGMAKVEDDRIVEIREKEDSSNLALAGIYIFPKEILKPLGEYCELMKGVFTRFGEFLIYLLKQGYTLKPYIIKSFWEYADNEYGYLKIWRWYLSSR